MTPINVTSTASPFKIVNLSTLKMLPRNKVKNEQVALKIEEEPRVVYLREALTKYKPMK
jgi:hypothetical protein